MNERPVAEATTGTVASTPVFVATFALLLALILVFLVLDMALGRIDRTESVRHAADLYREGGSLLAAGDAREAQDRFASALAIERDSTSYALGLAEALMAERRNDDAEQTLTGALGRAANDGALNLQMARLLARTGRDGEAAVYYHRAIFGRWNADSTQRRVDARFELVDALARRKEGSAMLAELLPLQAALPDSPVVRRRLAHLFLQAGAPERAMDIFRGFIHRDPRDADAYTGMAEAALALGNFATARADFGEAAHLDPGNPHIAARQALADTVLTLDPGARRLSESERSTRALALLARAVAERERCLGSPYVGAAADSARSWIATVAVPPTPERTDAITSLAKRIWTARPSRCATRFVPDEVLATVMGSLEP